MGCSVGVPGQAGITAGAAGIWPGLQGSPALQGWLSSQAASGGASWPAGIGTAGIWDELWKENHTVTFRTHNPAALQPGTA